MVVVRREVVPCLENACYVNSVRRRERKRGSRGGAKGGRSGDINNVTRVEQLCNFVYYSILEHQMG